MRGVVELILKYAEFDPRPDVLNTGMPDVMHSITMWALPFAARMRPARAACRNLKSCPILH
ncbi:MAG: hypothetical protein P4L68_03795 [Methylovirgula sp.]|nr:hypothetical protein [Methylovirgula sp.]